MKANIRSVIDLGSNTALHLIATEDASKILLDESRVVRLGEKVGELGKLVPTAMGRTLQCFQHFANSAHECGIQPDEILCVATAAMRQASNASAFQAQVKSETGISIQIISGEQEAELSFQGASVPGLVAAQMLLLDIGGGSTELSYHLDGKFQRHSIPFGCVNLMKAFENKDDLEEIFSESFSPILEFISPKVASKKLVGVAGTTTTLSMLVHQTNIYNPKQIDGHTIPLATLRQFQNLVLETPLDQRLKIPGLSAGREDVIGVGLEIMKRVMIQLNFEEITASSRGLRFGALMSFDRLKQQA